MNKSYNHPFHLVTLSPWPLLTSLSLMIMLIGSIKWFHEFNYNIFILGMMTTLLNNYQWWRDIIRESTFQGFHSLKVSKLLRMGMILFITSEIFFFISFFWAFFHMSLSPSIEIGEMWPPLLIYPFNPYNIPLLNTIILLTSGISITWSHYSILNKNFFESKLSLMITVILGFYFTTLQMFEYKESMFSISDSIYGSTFFMITGFHGLHVIIGTLFIMITMLRLMNYQFSPIHHFGFEASSWYWHFVDVIWLFVYISIYWWTY
uniref:Cytochrome c oxidase subunit 3 n=1 Tax=Diadromus collaris TaxID=7421 RepID=U5HTE5_9HYME|nr:cytochrome c oxidase subunit III [Diadromus collaris]